MFQRQNSLWNAGVFELPVGPRGFYRIVSPRKPQNLNMSVYLTKLNFSTTVLLLLLYFLHKAQRQTCAEICRQWLLMEDIQNKKRIINKYKHVNVMIKSTYKTAYKLQANTVIPLYTSHSFASFCLGETHRLMAILQFVRPFSLIAAPSSHETITVSRGLFLVVGGPRIFLNVHIVTALLSGMYSSSSIATSLIIFIPLLRGWLLTVLIILHHL